MKRGTVNPWQIANRSHRFVAPAMHIKSSSYSLHRKSVVVKTTEGDAERRKQLVWAIERKLAEDGARPIIFYSRGGTCWQPYVKGLTIMGNSITNGNRREDIWLDK